MYLCRPVAKKVIENPRVVSRFGNDVTEQSSSRVAFPSDDPGILIGQAFSRIRQVWKNLDEEHKHKRANPAIDGL